MDDLVLWSIKIPEPLHKHIKPRYNLAQFKENPAKIASQRMAYIEKLTQSLKYFSILKGMDTEAADKMKERCIALMHKRLNFGHSNKRYLA